MKTQFFIALLILSQLLGHSQDSNLPSEQCLIVLDNNKKIKSVRLWKINAQQVEYEQAGSLHDIPIERIKVIKLDDEIVTFDIHGQIEIRPYDVIISESDTIQCTITRVTSGNIYFYKQKGSEKNDYISRHMIHSYYHHHDSIVYQSFQDTYFLFASDNSVLETSENTTDSVANAQVKKEEENEDYVEYQAKVTVKPHSAGRIVKQIIVGTVIGFAGIIAGLVIYNMSK